MNKVIALISLCLLSVTSFTQQYYFNNYSVKEGLLQSNVTCGIQSENGYLWLGTEGGLSKYDGVNFKNFTKEDGLAESNITAIFEDANGLIWIGHQNGGITHINPNNGKLSIFSDTSIVKTISSISQDLKGNIWIATLGAGAFRFKDAGNNIHSSVYSKFLGKEGLGDYIFQIYNDKEGKIWFVSDVGIKSLTKGSNDFEFEKIKGLPSYQVTSICKDIDRNLWIGTYQGGVFKYNETTKNIKRFTTGDDLASNWISSIIQSKDKSMWIGTWGGGISQIQNSDIKTFKYHNGLQDEKIRFLLEDRESNIIIGTNEHGFSIYSGERFEIFNEETGLINNQIWSIEKVNKEIFIGHNNGVDVLENKETYSVPNFKYPVRALCSQGNNLWIGTWGNGVFKMNIKSKNISAASKLNSSISANVNNISADKNGDLWVSTIKGITKYNVNTKQITSFPGIIGKVQLDVTRSFPYHENKLLLGTRKNGLVFFDGYKFIRILENEIYTSPSSSVYDEVNNVFYVGTEGGGVLILKDNKIINKIQSKNGLVSNYILGVELDIKNNRLWISSNKGLSSYNLKTSDIRNYSDFDGYGPIEGKLNSVKNTGTELLVGTVGGMVKLNYSKDLINTTPPVINISKIRLNNEDTLLANNVELSYKYNSLKFYFDAICLTNSSEIKYKVTLKGWDDWHEIEIPQVNYSNLPEGEYTLLIRASNNDDVWNEEPLSFTFLINPPFWRTWWFYCLCGIILVLLIAAFIKIRERQLKQEKEVLALKVEERTAEVVEKSKELEHALGHIQASIIYAQRIQQAILPTDTSIKKYFPESFVFFKPRDVVSGDFYWLEKSGDEILFSAIDCTGHGVPGAFVSMVGHNLLNQSVRKHGLTKPSDILDDLHNEVKNTLQSNNDASVKDGMDLALCSFNPKTMKLQYAGAHNQLYLIRNGELVEYKASRFAIGFKGRHEGKPFDNNMIDIIKGDVIYIFTDGFIDQFGGEQGKKYMSKRFKRYLLEACNTPFNTQKEDIDSELNTWMKDGYKQIDDILVWGIKF